MDRRAFLKTGAVAACAGAVGSVTVPDGVAVVDAASSTAAPDVMTRYTAEDHRRRLEHIGICERGIRKCMRKHLILDYIPGQCVYNLCEYPAGLPWEPNEYDEQELDRLRDHGIGLIQVHNEWRDELHIAGGDVFTPHNPAGFRKFIDMTHRRGMKIIPYTSTGYFECRDPAWRSEWSRGGRHRATYWHLAINSTSSVGWRACLLPHLARLMDEYGVDGLYNDDSPLRDGKPTPDEVLPFKDGDPHAATYADLLALIYAEVKRRGGVYKLHAGGTTQPPTDLKIYDYLWVGECCNNMDAVREETKNHTPYCVPCLDFSASPDFKQEDDLYLNAIPYMQFPLLQAGRPFTGERNTVPGIDYAQGYRNLKQAWEHFQAHPEGPHPYGWWDSVPGRPEARPTHARWLKQYLPLVEEGTWAYLEAADSDLVAGTLPEKVVVSAFANRELHLVLANFGGSTAELRTADRYASVADPSAAPTNAWSLKARSMQILRRMT